MARKPATKPKAARKPARKRPVRKTEPAVGAKELPPPGSFNPDADNAQAGKPAATGADAEDSTAAARSVAPETAEGGTAPDATPIPVEKPEAFVRGFRFVTDDDVEGGYVNDPRDPGGETKFGISKRAYPKLDIASLTLEDAQEIYHRDYWGPAGCDDMPAPVAIAVFDCAINQGVGIAKRLIQKALGVTADGAIGPVTLGAMEEADTSQLVTDFLSWRLRRYAFTGNASTYMRGWSKRVLMLLAYLIVTDPENSEAKGT